MIKVFLVDRVSADREIMKASVDWKVLGMEIVGEAEDGHVALRLMEELLPHVVITEMRMAGRHGAQWLQLLHEHNPHLRKIVVSGHDNFNDAVYAMRYSAMAYLLKPIQLKELNAALLSCKDSLEGKQLKYISNI